MNENVPPSQNIVARARGISNQMLNEMKRQKKEPDDVDHVLIGIDATLKAIIEHIDNDWEARRKAQKKIITP